MKVMSFNGVIATLPNNLFQNHYVLVFALNSLQDAREKFHSPELSGESIQLEMLSDAPAKKRGRIICYRRKYVRC